MMPLYQAVITPADNQASKTHIITLKTNILRLLIPSAERAAELVRHSRELFHHSVSGFIHPGSPASEPGQHIGLCCERFVAERIRVDIKLLADSIRHIEKKGPIRPPANIGPCTGAYFPIQAQDMNTGCAKLNNSPAQGEYHTRRKAKGGGGKDSGDGGHGQKVIFPSVSNGELRK
jgi:hypothetical protein